jgi:hypothetical protein
VTQAAAPRREAVATAQEPVRPAAEDRSLAEEIEGEMASLLQQIAGRDKAK